MSRLRVKVCGITTVEDARLAVESGADAIGLVFWAGSPRHVSPARARVIAAAVPPFVSRVGVFVNAEPAEVDAVVRAAGLDIAQLHGDERIDAYEDVGARLVKVVTLEDDAALEAAMRLPPEVTPLVDALDPARRGGTGQRADWPRAAALSAVRATVLAGGLTAENVAQALGEVRPWAVDVSSGVEAAPGVKARAKLQAFFAAVRAAERP